MSDPRRLLIIDDEPDFCEILKAQLTKEGFEVLGAGDGKQGFLLATEKVPDCILLDIRIIEGEDGLTFLRRLRSFRHDDPSFQNQIRKLPVIVITATGDGMRPLFQSEGISDFIVKPFDTADLKSRILKAVSKS